MFLSLGAIKIVKESTIQYFCALAEDVPAAAVQYACVSLDLLGFTMCNLTEPTFHLPVFLSTVKLSLLTLRMVGIWRFVMKTVSAIPVMIFPVPVISCLEFFQMQIAFSACMVSRCAPQSSKRP